MKVETKPIEQKPEVVITLSWEEAEVLRRVTGMIGGIGRGRSVTSALFEGLVEAGVGPAECIDFQGSFNNRL